MKQTMRSITVLVSVSLMLCFNSCRSPLELTSLRRTSDITIDGSIADWKEATYPLVNHNATVGILYDEQFLYFCFTTADRQLQAQLLGPGITVWFDPEGKEKRSFGIQFPLGAEGTGRMMTPRTTEHNPDLLDRLLQRVRPEMELLGPGDQHQRIALGQQPGVSIRLGHSQDILVYELKVPLNINGQHAWAIEADIAKPISVGIETNEFPESRLQAPPGGASGGGRRGRAGGGLPNDPRLSERLEPLKLWLRVTPNMEGS